MRNTKERDRGNKSRLRFMVVLITIISLAIVSFVYRVQEMNKVTKNTEIIVQNVKNFKQNSNSDIDNIKTIDEQRLIEEVGQKENISYKNHYFYGESIIFELNNSQKVESYSLVDVKTYEVVFTKEYHDKINEGIDLRILEEGSYLIILEDSYLKTDGDVHEEEFYTVTRDGLNKKVKIEVVDDYIMLCVETINQLPNEIYDLVIDPGHGGNDTGAEGNQLYESEEVLKISKYLAQKFEEAGLKVKLTREDHYDPADEELYSYKELPYMDNGRVSQIYETKANYVISNHLNAYDMTKTGYQIFSSVHTTNEWASLISQELSLINRSAFDSNTSSRVSYGSFKEGYACESDSFQTGCLFSNISDYYYMIRETGGQLTHASGLVTYNEEFSSIPLHGAETILMEYAFIDNELDTNLWLNEWQQYADAVVKATLDYLEIK